MERCRPRRQLREVGLPSVRPHRLHLCDRRRGTGHARRSIGDLLLRCDRCRWDHGSVAGARSLRHDPRRRHHDLGCCTSAAQHGRSHGGPPGDGCDPAVPLARRLLDGGDPGCDGRADERRPSGSLR